MSDDLATWLEANYLQSYLEALKQEGYDDLLSLSMLPEDEVDELCTALKMKPGHKRKMPALVRRLKHDMKRDEAILEAKRKIEDAEREQEVEERLRKIETKKGAPKEDDENELVSRKPAAALQDAPAPRSAKEEQDHLSPEKSVLAKKLLDPPTKHMSH